MGNYGEFKVEINEKEIARLLGYKVKEPNEEMSQCIREEIEGCIKYIKPQITWEKVNIRSVSENRVILENNVVLQGEFIAKKLLKCQYVIVLVSTIGKELEEIVHKAFASEDYLKGMIVDNIGTTALAYINKVFWNKLIDKIKDSNMGITSCMSPGDKAWDIKEQTKIFQCLKGNEIGVILTESNMMLPIKSTSAIYGFGEEIGITRIGHICSECSMKNCTYRMEEKIEMLVNYGGKKRSLKVDKGSNLLDVLRENGVFLHSPCGGKGRCGKCKVLTLKGIEEPSSHDTEYLSEQELSRGIRLACAIQVNKALEISIENEAQNMEALTEGEVRSIDIEPMVVKKHLIMNKPNIDDQRDDHKRIAYAAGIRNLAIGYDLLPLVSSKLREADFDVTASIYKNEVLHIEAGDTSENVFGIAVDIGSTTIACYLINLLSGKTMDVESQVNKQRAYGADVISRINFTIENERGTEVLRDSIINQLNDMVEILHRRNYISPDNIYDMAVVGNTTMIHILLGIPTRNISMAPYIPVSTAAMDFRAKELGIRINGYVSILPGIASYIGSDITGGILSCGMIESEKYSLLLDLGTNGEIALGNCHSIITCATAAGPAFEGANIKCGVGGIKGAISKVNLNGKDMYQTIGGHKACGICGSGVLDMVSELIKYNLIDDTGRMREAEEITDIDLSKRMIISKGGKEFLLEEGTENGEPILFTQKDVREVQLAKAAICAGIQILLKEKGISYEDIEKVYIGGGFGNFMNVESSLIIGMIPHDLRGKIKSMGNCAGVGAKLYLLSENSREKTYGIIEKASYIELSNSKDFQDYYIESMTFDVLGG